MQAVFPKNFTAYLNIKRIEYSYKGQKRANAKGRVLFFYAEKFLIL